MWKRLGIGATGLLLAGTAVATVRTLTFSPSAIADAADVKLAPAPDIDVQHAARALGAAIRFQTISHQIAAENKAEEWTKLQSWLSETYPNAHHAMTREIVGGGTLVYKWLGSNPDAKPIILMAHQDVVPVTTGTEKDWKHAPYGGEIAEGAVWGRGAMDDKGSLIGLFEAIEALSRSGFGPRRTIYLVSGHDEEVGGAGAKAAATLLGSRHVRALYTLDEGSIVVENAPVINAPAIMIGVGEKGYATLRVTANAPGGHSSMPPVEIGTINLARAIISIHAKQFPSRLQAPVSTMMEVLATRKGGFTKVAMANRWLFGSLINRQTAATPAGAAMLHTTIAPTMLEGSPKENVLPQSANGLINYRIAPWQTSADVMAAAKSAIGKLPIDLVWDTPPREPSPISSTASEGWKLIRAAAEADTPGAPVAPYLVVAGTDSRNFTGISDDVYRFQPIHLRIEDASMAHGTNEHLTLVNLERMIRFYASLIATSAG